MNGTRPAPGRVPIQRSPSGLLGLFDIKALGQNPGWFEEAVQPVVDVTPWYLARQLQSEGNLTATTAAAVGDFVERTVPDGQAWYMVSGSCNFGPVVAGERVKLSFRVKTVDAGFERIFTSELMTAIAAAQLSAGFAFPQPLVLLPGCAIQCFVDDISVAAARPIGVSCAFFQLDV